MRTRPPTTITITSGFLIVAAFLLAAMPFAVAQDAATRITPESVGPALVGSTVDELIDQLGDEYDVGSEVRITVDFSGHVVSRDGQVQFRAVKADDPAPELTLFIINNQDFQTAEGVGPGTSIVDAEAVYGPATLRWNPDNESREFVEFENQPEGNIFFRTPGIGGNNVGVYADGQMETDDYDPDGMIAAIWIRCTPGEDCPGDVSGSDDTQPEPTATPEPTPEPTATPEPTPEPTATPEPTPEPTATPEPTPTPDSGDDMGGSGSDDGPLPETGSEQIILSAAAASLFLFGGGFVLFQRRYLAPAWLQSGRW